MIKQLLEKQFGIKSWSPEKKKQFWRMFRAAKIKEVLLVLGIYSACVVVFNGMYIAGEATVFKKVVPEREAESRTCPGCYNAVERYMQDNKAVRGDEGKFSCSTHGKLIRLKDSDLLSMYTPWWRVFEMHSGMYGYVPAHADWSGISFSPVTILIGAQFWMGALYTVWVGTLIVCIGGLIYLWFQYNAEHIREKINPPTLKKLTKKEMK